MSGPKFPISAMLGEVRSAPTTTHHGRDSANTAGAGAPHRKRPTARTLLAMSETLPIATEYSLQDDESPSFLSRHTSPETAQVLATFLEGAAVFALTRMWSDLLTSYVARLHPVPFCDTDFDPEPCADEASSNALFTYALILMPVAALLKHLAESTGLVKRPGMWDDCPMMINYFVGWAWSQAVLQALVEYKASQPDVLLWVGFELGFACVLTVLLGLIVVAIKPLSEKIECGSGKVIDWLEELVEDFWAVVLRAFSVTIMVVWTKVLNSAIFVIVPKASSESLMLEMQVLYAFTITYIVTIVSPVQGRAEKALLATIQPGESFLLGDDPSSQGWCVVPNWTATVKAVCGLSDVLQLVYAWVVGCAWSDVVTMSFTTLGALPNGWEVASNVLITVGLTLLVSVWLALTNIKYENSDETSREATEAFLSVNAAAFFIAWTWLVVARDLHAWYDWLLEKALVPWLMHLPGATQEGAAHATAVFGVATFSISLTLAMFALSEKVMVEVDRSINRSMAIRR